MVQRVQMSGKHSWGVLGMLCTLVLGQDGLRALAQTYSPEQVCEIQPEPRGVRCIPEYISSHCSGSVLLLCYKCVFLLRLRLETAQRHKGCNDAHCMSAHANGSSLCKGDSKFISADLMHLCHQPCNWDVHMDKLRQGVSICSVPGILSAPFGLNAGLWLFWGLLEHSTSQM